MRTKSLYFITCLTGLLLAGLSDSVYAQMYEPPKDGTIMTPSPNASAFMRYGDTPVSLFTGQADITIPIYTIERCGITIPIEFKYNHSGIKYDDVSMELGLGWTLNAGGIITQSIRGIEDNGSAFTRQDSSIASVLKSTDHDNSVFETLYETLLDIDKSNNHHTSSYYNQIDSECDIYSYSFLNRGGRFCFPLSQSFNDEDSRLLNLTYGLFIPMNGMWAYGNGSSRTIVDAEGVTYKFERLNHTVSDKFNEYSLTEIISADKADTVIFTYNDSFGPPDRDNLVRRPYINKYHTRKTTKKWLDIQLPTIIDYEQDVAGGVYDMCMYPPRLERIDFRGGYVKFEYLTDQSYYASHPIKKRDDSWRLERIRIYRTIGDNSSALLQTVTLHKSKFDNTEDRLDKVVFTASGQSYQYEFGYYGQPGNSDGTIMTRDSTKLDVTGIDYWGYYNGTTMASDYYVPTFTDTRTTTYGTYTYNTTETIHGANKEPNFESTRSGVLDKIVYPTKGYTEFTYESHFGQDTSVVKGAPLKRVVKQYGGLRIKEIRNYQPNGDLAELKHYQYGEQPDAVTGKGFGKANRYPWIYDFQTERHSITYSDDGRTPSESEDDVIWMSLPKRDYLICGSPVVYPEVTEYVGNENGDNGKTVYKYTVVEDVQMSLSGYGYDTNISSMPLRVNSWKSGNLSSKITYKKVGNEFIPVHSIGNSYWNSDQVEFRNLRVEQHRTAIFIDERDRYKVKTIPEYYTYYTTSGRQILTGSVETKDGVSKTTTYEYNAKGFPNKVVDPKGTTNYLYPTEKTTAPYTAMVAANMISMPVETKLSSPGNVDLYTSTTPYAKWGTTDLFAPTKHSVTFTGAAPNSQTTTYHKYDKFGNPVYITQADQTNVVYLWSYNSLYPVIQVQNATYAEVENALGASLISSLANNVNPTTATIKNRANTLKSELPNALVSYHTFEPLIGVKTITDPSGRTSTYSYDGFGRLLSVKDDEGRLVEAYEYNYSNL